MMKKKWIFVLLASLPIVGCSKETAEVLYPESDNSNRPSIQAEHPYEALLRGMLAKYPDTDYQKILDEAAQVEYFRGKSLAYLGASLVNLPECQLDQYLVEKGLGCSVTHYGHGGYGYAAANNLQQYAKNMAKHDIYVIWGTTNDYALEAPVGSPTDYTEADGYDKSKLNTACGGMNYAIAQVRRINPDALILGFTTVKMFNGVRTDGSMRSSKHTNAAGYHFFDYVDAQLACFERAKIPCLNVWDWNYFTHTNWSDFFMEDGVHLQYSGYFFLAMEHLKFLTAIGKQAELHPGGEAEDL